MRARKVAMIGAGSLFTLIMAVIALVLAVLSTAPGHNFVRKRGVAILENAVDGKITIGSLSGSLWRAADVRDITIATHDGKPVVRVARARVKFAASDLIRGRFRFSDITLERPVVVLEQDTSGSWNFERVFRLGPFGGGPSGKPRALVEFRNSRIVGGTLIMRQLPAMGSDEPRHRTVTNLNADFRRFRASHPDSSGFHVLLDGLSGVVRNPDIEVVSARGEVVMNNDSLLFALHDFRLPNSEAQINGAVEFGDSSRTTYSMTMEATRFAFVDFRGVIPQLPKDGGGRVLILARRSLDGTTEIEMAEAAMRSGRSTLSGVAHLVAAPGAALAIRNMNVELRPFDLAFLEPYVDSLPAEGLVYGSVSGRGTLNRMALVTELRFIDERITPAPVSVINGRGDVRLGGADMLVFEGFRVAPADIDARTIHAFAPSVELVGRVRLAGELTGPWKNAMLHGAVTHSGPVGEATTLRGDMAIDLRNSVALDINAVVDSVSLDLLRRSYPQIPVGGTMAGRVRLYGPLEGFNVSASLAGPIGSFSALGRVGVTDTAYTVVLDGTFDSLDLNLWQPNQPPSSLAGSYAVNIVAPTDSTRPATGSIGLSLRPGHVAGVPVMGGGLALRLDPTLMIADSLTLLSPGLVLEAAGALGRQSGARGEVEFMARSDTLAYLEPLVRWFRTQSGDTAQVRLDGSGQVEARVSGSAQDWTANGSATFGRIVMAGTSLNNLTANGSMRGGVNGTALNLTATGDTVAAAGLRFAPLAVVVTGRFDSLGLGLSAGLPRASAVHGQISVWGDSVMRVVSLDSLRLDLPIRNWRLEKSAAMALTEGLIVFDTVQLVPEGGAGRVLADGLLPRGGVGDFRVAVESLAVVDVYALMSRDTAGIGGAIDMNLHISGPSATPTIELAAVLQDGRFADYRAPLMQVLARYTDNLLTLKGGLWRDTTRVVALNGAVPVDLALVPVPRRKLPGPVSISMRSDSADLELFTPFITQVRDLSGLVSLDVSVGGTWDNLTYTGHVDITNGAMSVLPLGVRYNAMDLRLDLRDQVVTVTRGHIGGGPGAVDLEGRLLLPGARSAGGSPIQRTQIELVMDARQFRAFDMTDFGGITGSGRLSLNGPLIGATLTGRLTVDEGYLKFADLVTKRVVSLDDPEFRAIVDSTLAEASSLGPGFQQVFMDSLRIDSLGLAMGPDVWLRSTEANIQMAGEFAVHKYLEGGVMRYRMEGTLNTTRGNYRLAFASIVKDFRVTRGTIRFYGTPDFNPDIDIQAEHTLRTYQNQPLTVRAVIGGTLLYPRLRLETDQRAPLSETEIVSYLVTGAPLGSGAGLEATVAQNFVLGLAGQVGQSLVSELGLGLDYFTVTPGAQTQGIGLAQSGQSLYYARIGAGKQLGRRTFVSLNAGLCEVVSAQRVGASIEYRIRRSLSLTASFEPLVRDCRTASALSGLTAEYQLSFDLFWQRGLR